MEQAQQSFEHRVSKLSKVHLERTETRRAQRLSEQGPVPFWVKNLGYPASVVGVCILGVLSVLISRFAMFSVQSGSDYMVKSLTDTLTEIVLSLVIVFSISAALNMSSQAHRIAKGVGVFLALTLMHNLVHAYPETWERAFSPAWVKGVTQSTEPRSINLIVSSLSFTGKLAEE